jgi:uncharacterized protein
MTMTKEFELPRFKYFPNAYDFGLFREEDFICDICKTKQHFRYVGAYFLEKEDSKSMYKVTNSEYKICAHCIDNGKAAQKLNADFKNAEVLEQTCYANEHIDEEVCDKVIEEWLYKTPNFSTIETEIWPICCTNFTAFIGYLGKGNQVLNHLNLEDQEDLTKLTAKLEEKTVDELFLLLKNAFKDEAKRLKKNEIKVKNGEDLAQKLQTEEDYGVGYVFKCLDCGKYFVHVDLIQ